MFYTLGETQKYQRDINNGEDVFGGGIGNNQDNSEDDIKKARKKLKGAGFDAGDEQSGFLDKNLVQATKAFQQQQGLKEDGVMLPHGETETALNRFIARQSGKTTDIRGENGGYFKADTQPLVLQSPIGSGKNNLKQDVNTLENMLAGFGLIKQGRADQAQGQLHTEIINAVKIFQKENGLRIDGVLEPKGETETALNDRFRNVFVPQKQDRKSPLLENINMPVPDDKKESSYDPYAVPQYKKDWYRENSDNKSSRDNWIGTIKENKDLTERQKEIFTELFTAEGADAVYDGTTKGGITQKAFKDLEHTEYYKAMQNKYGDKVTPDILNHKDMQGFYKAYFDEYLKGAAKGYSAKNNIEIPKKGSELLDELGNQFVAAAMADSLFRHGSGDGTKLVQQAINATTGKENQITVDGSFGSGTFEKLQTIAKDEKQSKEFLKHLAEGRTIYLKKKNSPGEVSGKMMDNINIGGDEDRNKYFQFEFLNK